MKKDVYQAVTDQVIAQMETAGANWIKPFRTLARNGGYPVNGVTKKRYNGINVLLLTMAPNSPSGEWASYNQWGSIGGHVRKGEKATRIVFFKPLIIKGKTEGEKDKKIPLLREYCVFSREQVDGLKPLAMPELKSQVEINAGVDAYVANTQARISHVDGGRAFYMPSMDSITMPLREAFSPTPTSSATEAYYSTLLHELSHWTGHSSRLDRLELKNNRGYAFEELIAELSAAMLCAGLGISSAPREDHAQYLNNWLAAIKDDPRAIFKAAAEAQKAVSFLDAMQPEAIEERDEEEAEALAA